MSCQPKVFGRSNSVALVATSVRGENGWWILPPGWFAKPNPLCGSEVIASPNADFSAPNYYCTLDDSGQNMAFQDLLLLKATGQDNPYGLQSPI